MAPFRRLRHRWAKGQAEPERSRGLVHHTHQVLRRLGELLRRHGLEDDPALAAILSAAAWAHDLGKLSPRFQDMLRGGPPARLRHEVLSLGFLPLVARDARESAWLAAAVASHHRDLPDILQLYPPDLPQDWDLEEEWQKVETLAAAVAAWARLLAVRTHLFPWAGRPGSGQAPCWQAVVGGLQAGSALARGLEAPGQGEARHRAMLVRGLLQQADHLASAGAEPLEEGWSPTLQAVLGDAPLRPVQERLWGKGKGDFLLSAPCGAGKTEAALLWVSRQGPSRPLTYLLPYQASLNAMRGRLVRLLGQGEQVGLLHGHAAQVLWQDYAVESTSPQEAARRVHAAQDRARLWHPAVRLSTPYQLLSAIFCLPGYEALWASQVGCRVVVDEVHAYEPIRLGLILALLSVLRREWDARLLVLSATIPGWLRRIVLEELELEDLGHVPSGLPGGAPRQWRVVAGTLDQEDLLGEAVQAVRAGEVVLITANAVDSAVRLRRLLAARLEPEQVCLVHSRFGAKDRADKERLIEEHLKGQAGLAVVATQVVEVSLDWDFHRLFTEPGPLDALVQRSGRVNRRGTRPTGEVTVVARELAAHSVYDACLVDCALAVLKERATWREEELPGLLDQAYQARSAFLAEQVAAAARTLRRAWEGSRPFVSDREARRKFRDLFQGVEVLPSCRLERYREQVRNSSVLEASLHLVPVGPYVLRWAGERVKWDQDLRVWVADLPYDRAEGLLLHPADG
ncbi:MAG: CRISPR-associated helicase Cas3' [Thermaerobacter sp.]|nr:CRISPR-associated helicase Cas3' [Thermaerobacter sp.]